MTGPAQIAVMGNEAVRHCTDDIACTVAVLSSQHLGLSASGAGGQIIPISGAEFYPLGLHM